VVFVKLVFQFSVILLVSFIGEALRLLIPLPVPASIYGLVIMLFCLKFKIIKIENVKKAGYFLIEIMPLMFIPPAVGLIATWNELQGVLLPVIIITLATTVIVMAVSGRIAQTFLSRKKEEEE